MNLRLTTVAQIAFAIMSFAAFLSTATAYPERMVEIVVPSTPGSGADMLGRVLADGLSTRLGQRFIVLNKPGASGVIATAALARAKPDGYSLMHAPAFSLTVSPLMDLQVGYSHKSFEPICQTFKNDQVIVVRPDSPLQSVADLVRAAKARPGALNYGLPGLVTIPHLAMVEFSEAAKVEFNAIPFRGPVEAVQMVLGRQVDFAVVPLPSAATSGLAMPALFGIARNPSIPQVPTMREQGYEVAPGSFGGLFAPAGLSTVTKRLLASACAVTVQNEAYRTIAKRLFQPSEFFADSEDFARNLEQDITEKSRLLRTLRGLK